MKFKAKKRVILSDFEPFLTLKFAKKMFSRAILPYRAVAKVNWLFKQHLLFQGDRKKALELTNWAKALALGWGIRNPNPQRHKRQICRNNALKCSLIDKLLTALLPFLAKNLLFLNSQTQCAEKFLFSCYCRVKQGCRLANPERTAERKFNKHWAHVFGFLMPLRRRTSLRAPKNQRFLGKGETA